MKPIIRWNGSRQSWEVVEGFRVVASFDWLWQAEAHVIAESKRREEVA